MGKFTAFYRENTSTVIAFALLLVIVPLLPNFWIKVFTSMVAVAIAAQGVAVLHARLGQVSLAGIALMGVGGWIALRVTHWMPALPFEAVLIATVILSAAVGVVLGLPAIRHRGLIFALVTLMFAAGFHVVVSSTGFPDGGTGFLGRTDGSTARATMERPTIAGSDTAYYIYALVIAFIAFFATWLVLKSATGRAWAMMRAGDTVAKSVGVRMRVQRAKAFALIGALSGAGGCLLAGSIGQLDGRSFDPIQSLLLYGLVIIAGPWSMLAALLAAFLYRVFPALLNTWGVDGDIAMIIFGVALIHAIVGDPRGVSGALSDLGKLITSKFRGATTS
jgi:branched-chain amino acid transport system permease protein